MSVFRGVYSFSEIEICIGSRISVFSDTNAECMDHLPTLAVKIAIAEKKCQNSRGEMEVDIPSLRRPSTSNLDGLPQVSNEKLGLPGIRVLIVI